MKATPKLLLITCTLALSACNGFFEKDNLPTPNPLPQFQAQITPQKLWSIQTGATSGDAYLRITPASNAELIYTVSKNGYVSAVQKDNGTMLWHKNLSMAVSSSVGADNATVIIAGRNGDIYALDAKTGADRWQHHVEGEILAQPAVAGGVSVIKTIDGHVYALNTQDGSARWDFQQTEPNMILRGASAPVITGQHVFVGFANGNLAKLNIQSGELAWLNRVTQPEGAFTIQRMIDIDADPVITGHHIYAATYQGKIASLDWAAGKVNWSQKISSYTGMAVNDDAIFVSDASSHVWRFNARNGALAWQQKALTARGVSAPALISHYIVVGDAEGYVHWLDQADGKFVARTSLGAAIYATPLVEGNTVYVINNRGYLAAYSLSK